VTVCPECFVSYEVWLEAERVCRAGCRDHRTETVPPDPDRVRALRRAWAKGPAYAVRPAAPTVFERAEAVDVRDAQRLARELAVTSTDDLLLLAAF
jgi:hypothetical protein